MNTAGTYSAVYFSNVWPRQTQPSLMLATTCAATGITVLAWATSATAAAAKDNTTAVIYGMMALTGYGVGLSSNPGSLHALAYFPAMTAPITCLGEFAFPLGGTVGLTLMSTVFNNAGGADADAEAGGEDGVKTAISWAFVAIVPVMWCSVLAAACLGNVWILQGDGNGGHDVVHGAWLWHLLRGKPLERHRMSREDPAAGSGGDDNKLMPLRSLDKAQTMPHQIRSNSDGAQV